VAANIATSLRAATAGELDPACRCRGFGGDGTHRHRQRRDEFDRLSHAAAPGRRLAHREQDPVVDARLSARGAPSGGWLSRGSGLQSAPGPRWQAMATAERQRESGGIREAGTPTHFCDGEIARQQQIAGSCESSPELELVRSLARDALEPAKEVM